MSTSAATTAAAAAAVNAAAGAAMAKQYAIIYLEDGWENQIKAKALNKLEAILEEFAAGKEQTTTKLFSNREYADVYTVCYNMCTQRSPFNYSEQLYQRHSDTIANYLSTKVFPALKNKQNSGGGEVLLQELARRGSNHEIFNKWLQRFFQYLDRYYVKYHSLPSLEDSGRRLFKQIIFDPLKYDVARAVLELVDKEREGAVVDRGLIATTVQMFETMGQPTGSLEVYIQDFETHFLSGTRAYYARKTEAWLRNDCVPSYMKKVETALRDEKLRVKHYLRPESCLKIQKVVEDEMITRHMTELLEKEGSGFRVLLANDMGQDLSRMYRLFLRVPGGVKPMGEILKSHIVARCSEKIAIHLSRMEQAKDKTAAANPSGDREDPQFVKDLIDIHVKVGNTVKSYLESDGHFNTAIKESFVEVLNRNNDKVKVAYLLSSFCDSLLKAGSSENINDVYTENFLEQVVRLFSYLDDKDMFAQMYRVQLSKRLLNQRSASDDMERSMIGKLKLQCGSQFTTKMEGMLNDLSIGVEHATLFETYFKECQDKLGLSNIDFSVQVLTIGHWPVVAPFDIKLPPLMLTCAQTFNEFYARNASKRKLQWNNGLGNTVVKGKFGNRSYDLQMTTLQAIVLLVFNNSDKPMLFSHISSMLAMPEEHLKRALHSLACGKLKILKRIQLEMPASYEEPVIATTKQGNIKASDSFTVNDSFTSHLRKIRLPMAALEESSQNPKQVDEDRAFATDAAIMRIMKARKVLQHQELIAEVLTHLSFFRADPKVRELFATCCRLLCLGVCLTPPPLPLPPLSPRNKFRSSRSASRL